MILLTGGAGYIGSVAVRELLSHGYTVRVLDKFLYGDYPLADVRDDVDVIHCDICQIDDSVLDGVESVIHLAGFSNDPTSEVNPEANRRMNTEATQALAEACKRKGIGRFPFFSPEILSACQFTTKCIPCDMIERRLAYVVRRVN